MLNSAVSAFILEPARWSSIYAVIQLTIMKVAVSGGVGQARVRLPAGVGIWAEAHGGIGHIDVQGLTKKDDHWENDLYDSAKTNIRVKVEGGIGQIEIHAE